MYDIEDIPDEDSLFYRIHKLEFRDGIIIPGAFKERGEGVEKGMSTNWSKYSNGRELLDVAKVPKDNAIVRLSVLAIRNIHGRISGASELLVEHAPLSENRSHSHVKGIPHKGALKPKVRLALSKTAIFEFGFE